MSGKDLYRKQRSFKRLFGLAWQKAETNINGPLTPEQTKEFLTAIGGIKYLNKAIKAVKKIKLHLVKMTKP